MVRVSLLLFALALTLAAGCRRPPPPSESGEGEQAHPQPELPIAQPPPTCDGQPCEPPRQCVSYFGIAGPSGPTFYSCELRCEPGLEGGCPEGMRCVTIADGPGDVCRPQ
ncbi:MAG: hypothetical protein R6X02_24265 [Enhygromyxa sp.]